MSGHSKWSTIKRQKGANDAKRGQAFTKLANAITIAVREGGGADPNSNIRLRFAIDKAREANMPKDNIERAIVRAAGKEGAAGLETVTYEGYGPHNSAVIVEAITDNRNRTAAEVKTVFDKSGGVWAQPGSVSWQFERIGLITVPAGQDSETITLAAIDAGAQDIEEEESDMMIITAPEKLHEVKTSLEQSGFSVTNAEITMRPKQVAAMASENDMQDVLGLLDKIESIDDVSTAYTNAVFETA